MDIALLRTTCLVLASQCVTKCISPQSACAGASAMMNDRNSEKVARMSGRRLRTQVRRRRSAGPRARVRRAFAQDSIAFKTSVVNVSIFSSGGS